LSRGWFQTAKNLKIVAVGGGEIGRPGTEVETLEIDRRAAQMTGKARPALTFLPTASNDSPLYIETAKRHFGGRLGCEVVPICLYSDNWSQPKLRETVLGSDIIYVGGGNTRTMLEKWREHALDALLVEAAYRGVVLAGVSAGAMCWFQYGISDSVGADAQPVQYGLLRGLGLLPIGICPHFGPDRLSEVDLPALTRKAGVPVICLTDSAALLVQDGVWHVALSRVSASASVAQYEAEGFACRHLEPEIQRPLDLLLSPRPRNAE
jgi:dipeptidase E